MQNLRLHYSDLHRFWPVFCLFHSITNNTLSLQSAIVNLTTQRSIEWCATSSFSIVSVFRCPHQCVFKCLRLQRAPFSNGSGFHCISMDGKRKPIKIYAFSYGNVLLWTHPEMQTNKIISDNCKHVLGGLSIFVLKNPKLYQSSLIYELKLRELTSLLISITAKQDKAKIS